MPDTPPRPVGDETEHNDEVAPRGVVDTSCIAATGHTDGPQSWLTGNLPLLVTIGAFVAVALKVFVVARFDPATAAIVVQGVGVAAVFLGVLAPLVPGLFVVGGLLAALWAGGGDRKHGFWSSARGAIMIGGWVVAVAGVLAVPMPNGDKTTLGVVATAAVSASNSSAPRFSARSLVGLLAVTLLAGFFLFNSSWLPPEEIYHGGTVAVGYVLKETQADLVVLDEANRHVERIKVGDVSSRRYCRVGKDEKSVVASWFSESSRPDVPRCRKLGNTAKRGRKLGKTAKPVTTRTTRIPLPPTPATQP